MLFRSGADGAGEKSMADTMKDALGGLFGGGKSTGPMLGGGAKARGRQSETLIEAAAKSAVRTIGSSLGREIVRGVLGGLLGGKR